ncbi:MULTISPECIES: carbohydrate kinase family protein [Marinobacter]|jgi:acarbose 7IV-phosphotransferase|uniref:carbohydrate kinase family protein n=2 Tax=Marinobacteraceae TaxID=2887365 RepID=UPI002942112A|nr:carbohydrate kinase family protein [Marinobacter salarius]WOI20138.1 carbohydrate kinase family protein [Marinobacter salarius]
MKNSIVIIGGASLDTIVQLDALPTPTPQTLWPRHSYKAVGSTGAGKTLNLAALGHPVVLHTLLGKDTEADRVRHALAKPGIELLAEITDTPTEQHVNLMDPHGGRISLFVQPPADPAVVDWVPVAAAISDCTLVVINILGYTKPAMTLAKNANKPIWTDLHDYDGRNPHHQPFIESASVIFLSSDNLPDYRGFMERMIGDGKELVVCTHGSDGATLLSRDGQWVEQPAFQVRQVQDTNGAGDAFFSGFLCGYLRGENLQTCLRLGAACGALCVSSRSLAAENLSLQQLHDHLRDGG